MSSDINQQTAAPLHNICGTRRMFNIIPKTAPHAVQSITSLSFFKGVRICMMRICSILTIMRMGMVIIMGAIAPSYPLPAMTRIISVAKKMAKIAKGMDTVKMILTRWRN